jgi:uncharacterized membrane protein
MVKFEIQVTVDRPVEDVFKYVTDVSKLPDWQSTLSEIRKASNGPLAIGATLVETRKFLARRWESTLKVVGYEPNRTFAVESVSGPMQYAMAYRFDGVNGSTKVTLLGTGEPGPFFKLAEPLVSRAAEREFRGDLETLKDVLESNG